MGTKRFNNPTKSFEVRRQLLPEKRPFRVGELLDNQLFGKVRVVSVTEETIRVSVAQVEPVQ